MVYHHYKKELIPKNDRIANLERFIIDELLHTVISDDERESSIAFELKHHHSTAQFARLIAMKRKLDIDICTAGALLHDFSVIRTGKYADHAHKSAEIAINILDETGKWTSFEKEQIYKIIYNHSDKHIFSQDSYEEFGKDVDVLDCFLYPSTIEWYKENKPKEYFDRAKLIFAELGVEFYA